jgi:hypothetical protein
VSPRIRRLGRRVVLQHEISLIYHRLRSGAGHAENGRFAGLLVDVSLDGVLQVLLAGSQRFTSTIAGAVSLRPTANACTAMGGSSTDGLP